MRTYCQLGVSGLKTSFGSIGPERLNNCQSVNLEPWLQFSQTRPNFIQNQEMNPMNFSNVEINLHPGVFLCGLKTSFGPAGTETFSKP